MHCICLSPGFRRPLKPLLHGWGKLTNGRGTGGEKDFLTLLSLSLYFFFPLPEHRYCQGLWKRIGTRKDHRSHRLLRRFNVPNEMVSALFCLIYIFCSDFLFDLINFVILASPALPSIARKLIVLSPMPWWNGPGAVHSALFSLEWVAKPLLSKFCPSWACPLSLLSLSAKKASPHLQIPRMPPNVESSGKVLTCLLFLLLGFSQLEASLWAWGDTHHNDRQTEAVLHMQQLPLPHQEQRQRTVRLAYLPGRGYSTAVSKETAFCSLPEPVFSLGEQSLLVMWQRINPLPSPISKCCLGFDERSAQNAEWGWGPSCAQLWEEGGGKCKTQRPGAFMPHVAEILRVVNE